MKLFNQLVIDDLTNIMGQTLTNNIIIIFNIIIIPSIISIYNNPTMRAPQPPPPIATLD